MWQERRHNVPLFTFHCPDCDKDMELLVRISDTPVCPSCGGQRLEQLVSRIAPDSKTRAIIQSNRAAAAREGHLSNFSPAERRLK